MNYEYATKVKDQASLPRAKQATVRRFFAALCLAGGKPYKASRVAVHAKYIFPNNHLIIYNPYLDVLAKLPVKGLT
jgi:hypothetical protein